MIQLALLILLLPFVGGFAIGAMIFGRWRRRLLLIWATLPLVAYLVAYSGLLLVGQFQSAAIELGEGFAWMLVGLSLVVLPTILFAGSSVLGYFVAPAPKRAWRLKDWRLPQ